MISDESRQKASETLLAAYESRSPVSPLVETFGGMGIEDAYEIQQLQVAQWKLRGEAVKGHKVGLTSLAMQKQLGVDQPDFGHLMSGMFYLESQPIAPGGLIAPRIEPEIAFVLRRALTGPGVTVAEAASAVEFVLPALEVIDSRIRDWKITIADTIADNASSAGVVLAGRPTPLHAVDLRRIACTLTRDGEAVAQGSGDAVLGSPLNALVWLANTLGSRGVSLTEGHVILPGSMTPAIPVSPGLTIMADMGELGTVTAVFGE